jgi:hypothetical protein
MSKELEPFERRLRGLPLRHVPAEWRKEIVSAAGGTQAVPFAAGVSRGSFLSNFNRRLASILWPHPVAWGALAAIWMFIFVANCSIRDEAPAVAEKNATPSPGMLAELRAQKRLYLELTDTNANEPNDADRQKRSVPGPRSEVEDILTV